MAGLVVVAAAAKGIVPDAPGNRYVGISDRNVFHLVAPTNLPPITQPEAPRPKIIPTGIITGYLGNKRVLFKVQFPANPPQPAKEQSYVLAEGQREGDIEVLEINETTSMIKFSNHGTLMTLSLERDGAKPPPPTGAPPATVVGAPPSPVGYPVAQPPTNVSPLTRTIRQVPPPPMTPNAVPTQPNPAVPNVAVPQAQATERPLTPEEQIILMEVERERNKARIQNGTLPPLPPTPLTPQ